MASFILMLFVMDGYSQGIINNYLFGYTGPTRGKMNPCRRVAVPRVFLIFICILQTEPLILLNKV